MGTAILVLSRDGLELARRLRAGLPGEALIYGPSCVVGACGGAGDETGTETKGGTEGPPVQVFATSEPDVFGWLGPLRRVFPALWERHEAIVAIMALGIVARLAGPLARDKRRDPAVVVVDDAGRFAISVLGGHGSGANRLAERVAGLLGAQPVITTASEAHGVPAADQIGRDLGWSIERAENLTRVAAATVRRQRVAVWQDAGSPDWWRPFGPWPEHFLKLDAPDGWRAVAPAALLVISDRALPADLPADRTLVYRPKSLIAGIGCRRGTPAEKIAAWAAQVFAEAGLALGSLGAVATVTLKADEPGLLAFAEARGVPLLAFPPGELAGQPGVENPSERVRARIGIPAVAEPAALRASGAARLLVPKRIGPGVTVAVARKPNGVWAGPPRPRAYQAKNGGGPKAGAETPIGGGAAPEVSG